MENCIFCNIARKKTPSYTIYEDDYLCAILDINPSIPGHTILILKTHYSSLKEADDNEIGHLLIISKKISNILSKILNIEGTSIFIADGELAGQKAPHVLMHIIPRVENDKINLNPLEKNFDENKIMNIKNQLLENIKHDFNMTDDEMNSFEELDNKTEKNCHICNINTEDQKGNIIYKDNELIAYLPKDAVTLYHIQVAPRMHFPVLGLTPDDLAEKLIILSKKLSITIAKTFNINSCNILLRNGIPAGQKYPHVILDLIPRIENDNINLNWEPKETDKNLLENLALAIRAEAETITGEDTREVLQTTETNPIIGNEDSDDDEKDYLLDSLNRRG